MTLNDAIFTISQLEDALNRAIGANDVMALPRIAQEFAPRIQEAGAILSKTAEDEIAALNGGPFQRLMQAFWNHYKATNLMLTIENIISMAEQQHEQQKAVEGLSSLGNILDNIQKK